MLTAGHRHEMTVAEQLLDYARGRAVIGDTGYDSDALVREIRYRCALLSSHAQTPPSTARSSPVPPSVRVQCLFHDLKRFGAVASRYDKTATNYLAMVEVACAWLWLK